MKLHIIQSQKVSFYKDCNAVFRRIVLFVLNNIPSIIWITRQSYIYISMQGKKRYMWNWCAPTYWYYKTIKSVSFRYFDTYFVHNIRGVSDRQWHDSLSMYYKTKKPASLCYFDASFMQVLWHDKFRLTPLFWDMFCAQYRSFW